MSFMVMVSSCISPRHAVREYSPGIDEEKIFEDAAGQYSYLMQHIPADSFPKNFDPKKNSYEWSSSEWWCSGFYPGSLLYLYEETKNKILLTEAKRMLKLLEKEQFNTGTHDLGFMMFCSFGNANRIEPKKEYQDILLNSAKSLSTRFNSKVGCIRSWNSGTGDFIVIIDNMMNLELLFWATKQTGDSSYYNIAVTHANTTIKNHFRPDNSSYHVVNYDPQTGAVKEKRTAQGYSNESAWARGQAWGLYGFILMYRETKDPVYLEQAEKIAKFILNHPNFPADKIPFWDFNASSIPEALRDASSAAILASALLELHKYLPQANYYSVAGQILQTLSTPGYMAQPGTNGGFILKHGVGHFPAKTEVDVALSYADYYFIEAMRRYKQVNGN
jgi:unsaturated chondroitin disaccharide hydrolase